MRLLTSDEIKAKIDAQEKLNEVIADLRDGIKRIELLEDDFLDAADTIARLIREYPKISGHTWALDDCFGAIRGMQVAELYLRRHIVDIQIKGLEADWDE